MGRRRKDEGFDFHWYSGKHRTSSGWKVGSPIATPRKSPHRREFRCYTSIRFEDCERSRSGWNKLVGFSGKGGRTRHAEAAGCETEEEASSDKGRGPKIQQALDEVMPLKIEPKFMIKAFSHLDFQNHGYVPIAPERRERIASALFELLQNPATLQLRGLSEDSVGIIGIGNQTAQTRLWELVDLYDPNSNRT